VVDDGIVEAIRDGHDSFKALGPATQLPAYNLKRGLQRLIAAGRVVATGATSNRRFSLPSAKGPAATKSFLGIA
jgi:hypothetical protein